MKNKLKLKHLAPYLPYALKGIQKSNGLIWWLYKESNICRAEDNYHSISINDFLIYELKPILRPLSDLQNKDLDYWIDFSEEIGEMNTDYLIYALLNNTSYMINVNNSYLIYQALFKMHVDVFGLIDKGLAIDINTL